MGAQSYFSASAPVGLRRFCVNFSPVPIHTKVGTGAIAYGYTCFVSEQVRAGRQSPEGDDIGSLFDMRCMTLKSAMLTICRSSINFQVIVSQVFGVTFGQDHLSYMVP
ncbi:hypothetical protein BBP40_007412 [Aspergillus hancockii]|nr:hypothetical protein BBP40_007412 [Aspergillus hancockii]